jgi:4-hydroxy-tetrahydrodipicolinate synthase
LTAIDQVVAIKMATLDSVMTFQDVANLLQREAADVSLITGEDRFMGYSLMCGATGALVGMGAACTGMQKELVTAHLASDGDRFLALSRQVDAFAQATFFAPMEGYIQRMLWALCHLGVIDRSACHDPWGPALPTEEFDQLKAVMQDIGHLR